MILIKNLKFKYPSSTNWILDIPNFEMKKGDKFFLYGPSGCGKTTLLEILAGMTPATEGILSINNFELNLLPQSQKDQFRGDHLGYIFQNFNLIPYLNVEENISLPLYLSPIKRQLVPQENEKNQVLELCQQLGIKNILNRPVTELSLGQQQRVAAARAFIGKPALLLADEPTSSLDYDHREKFIQLLLSLSAKYQTTVLFVSHDRTLEKHFDQSLDFKTLNLLLPALEDLT